MKDEILALRKQGKTYKEICDKLKCSKSLISYYINPQGKSKNSKRQQKNRIHKRKNLKDLAGGGCSKCNYSKCYAALQFHHTDPSKKKFDITDAIWNRIKVTEKELKKEISKCILLCANCHAELHYPNLWSYLSKRRPYLSWHPQSLLQQLFGMSLFLWQSHLHLFKLHKPNLQKKCLISFHFLPWSGSFFTNLPTLELQVPILVIYYSYNYNQSLGIYLRLGSSLTRKHSHNIRNFPSRNQMRIRP